MVRSHMALAAVLLALPLASTAQSHESYSRNIHRTRTAVRTRRSSPSRGSRVPCFGWRCAVSQLTW
jgi:hypothetical protein